MAMISFKKVYKTHPVYQLLKWYTRFVFTKVHFRRVVLLNKHLRPVKKPTIYAPNHQNALIDALAISLPFKQSTVYLARADIFKKKFQARVLRMLKIMPVYRLRDGVESMKNNQTTFDNAVRVLNHNVSLTIFPEGNHSKYRRLRSLKKGLARIAFQTAATSNYELDIQIVPVGLDYTDFIRFRSVLTLNFGQPIALKDYYDEYKENPVKAQNRLMKDLYQRLKPLMLHVETQQYYNETELALRYFNNDLIESRGERDFKRPNQMKAEQEIANCFYQLEQEQPDQMKQLADNINTYREQLNQFNIRDWIIKKARFPMWTRLLGLLALIITWPVFFYGYVNNMVAWHGTLFFTRNVKDPQFLSSFRFAIYGLLSPVWYILQVVLIGWLLIGDFWWAAAYMLSVFLGGYLAFVHYIQYKKWQGTWRFSRKKNRKAMDKMLAQRHTIRKQIVDLCNEK